MAVNKRLMSGFKEGMGTAKMLLYYYILQGNALGKVGMLLKFSRLVLCFGAP